MSARSAKRARRAKHRATAGAGPAAGAASNLPRTIALLALVALAFLIRLGALLELRESATFYAPQIDSLEYHAWAQDITASRIAWPTVPIHGPGYAFFLAGEMLALGDDLLRIRVAQALVGALSCLLVALLGSRLAGPHAGLIAGVIAAVYAPLVYTEIGLFAEVLVVLFNLLALLLALKLLDRPQFATAAMLGLCLGLSAITRSTGLLLIPLFAWLLWRGIELPPRRRAARIGMIAAAAALVIAPVTWQNWRAEADLVPVQRNGGLNFYIGNGIGSDGGAHVRLGGNWDRLLAAPYRAGLAKPTEHDRFYLRRWWSEVRADPLRYLGLLLRKTYLTFHARELRDTHDPAFFEQVSLLLHWLPGWGMLFPLAALGWWWQRRERRAYRLLEATIALYLLTCIVLVVGSRYRLPAAPPLAIYAALGLVGLWQRWTQGRRAELLRAAAVAAAFALVIRLPWGVPVSNFAEEWSLEGDAALALGQTGRAAEGYRRALEIDPDLSVALAGDGSRLLLAGEVERARRRFERVIEADPDFAKPYFFLGLVQRAAGRHAEAARFFELGAERRPETVRGWIELGRSWIDAGRYPEAEAALQRAERLRGDRAEVHYQLARVATLQARHQLAAERADRALDREPDHFESWMLLAYVRLDLKDPKGARAAIERARALAPADPRPPYVSAQLYIAQRRYQPAIQDLRRALQLKPDFAEAQYVLDRLLRAQADRGDRPPM